MSNKKSIKERREDALYKFAKNSNGHDRRELMDYLLATISHKQIKEAVEYFNIEVE